MLRPPGTLLPEPPAAASPPRQVAVAEAADLPVGAGAQESLAAPHTGGTLPSTKAGSKADTTEGSRPAVCRRRTDESRTHAGSSERRAQTAATVPKQRIQLDMEQKKLMTAAVKEHEYSEDLVIIDPRHTCPDPLNREETDLSANRVHSLIYNMVGNFSMLVNDPLYVIDIPPGRKDHCVQSYQRQSGGDELLPPLDPMFPTLYTVIGGNHFSTIGRAFLGQCPTTPEVCKLGVVDSRGRLCMTKLSEVDPEMAAYLPCMRAKRLKPSLCDFPYQIRAIANALNNDDKMAKTEAELLVATQAALFPRRTPGDVGAETPNEALILRTTTKLQKDFNSMTHYVKPVVDFCLAFGDPASPLVMNLHRYHSTAVDGSKVKMSPNAWSAFSRLPPALARGVEALIKFNWRKEFALHGIGAALTSTAIQGFGKGQQKASLARLDRFLRDSDKEVASRTDALLPAVRTKLVGNHDSLSAWVTAKQKVTIEQRVVAKDDKAVPHTDGRGRIEIELTTLDDAHAVYAMELALARGVEEHALTSIRGAVEGLVKKRKAEDNASSVTRRVIPRYGEKGDVTNSADLLRTAGVRAGATVQTKTGNDHAKQLEKAKVISISAESGVTLRFENGAVVTYSIGEYPEEDMQVVALPDTEGNSKDKVIPIDNAHAHRLRSNGRWGVSLTKAHVIKAMDTMTAAQQEKGFNVDTYVRVDR